MASPLPTPDGTTSLLASLSEDVADYWQGPTIARLSAPPSAAEFLREYVGPSRPVIMKGAVDDWPALARWRSDSYLEDRIGDAVVTVNFTPDGHGDHLTEDATGARVFCKPQERRMPFREFAEELRCRPAPGSGVPRAADGEAAAGEGGGVSGGAGGVGGAGGRGVPYLSFQNDSLRAETASLLDDVAPEGLPFAREAFGSGPEAINIWMGDERSESAMHKVGVRQQ